MYLTYLAVDPGVTTGWAKFDTYGELVDLGQDTKEDFYNLLFATAPHMLIVEGFSIRREKASAFIGDKLEVVQMIGALDLYAFKQNIPMILQPSDRKPMGYKYAGKTPPKNHAISHQFDAMAHGVFYLVHHKILEVKL